MVKNIDKEMRSDLLPSLREILKRRAPNSQCISYKALANMLNISTAPVIATITGLLETLIDEDVKSGRPILSALVVQKGKKGTRTIPRKGFYEKLHQLNVIVINDAFEERGWHENELEKLKMYYKK